MGALLIQSHQMRDEGGFGNVGRKTVGGKDGGVVRAVRPAEIGRHREGVVEVGEGGVGVECARIEDRLRRLGDFVTQQIFGITGIKRRFW